MAGTGRRVVVAGAGDVGLRLAILRATAGDEVIALRRSFVGPLAGIDTVQADLLTGAGLASLPRDVDAVVFSAAPDRREEDAYRRLFIDGQRRLLDALGVPPQRWIFVSSTAVYGEDGGGWVDEATATGPSAFNGRVLVEAERTVADLGAGACALRFSGLYGPGRTAMLRRAVSGEAPRPRWTNRIHVEDAAAALSHLLELESVAPCYLGSDDEPAREDTVQAWVRSGRGLPPLVARDEPVGGRRVCNARLRATGWTPRYPDFRAGYATLLHALD